MVFYINQFWSVKVILLDRLVLMYTIVHYNDVSVNQYAGFYWQTIKQDFSCVSLVVVYWKSNRVYVLFVYLNLQNDLCVYKWRPSLNFVFLSLVSCLVHL